MKKSILFLGLSLAILSLTSCHSPYEYDEFEIPSTFDESKEYNIEFWAKNDGNTNQTKIYKQAINDFEEIYPNINVTIRNYASYDSIYRDVITNIGSGTPPNVCISYPDHVATYQTNEDIIIPLDKLINDPSFGFNGNKIKYNPVGLNNVYDNYLNEGIINDKLYTLPFVRSSECLYINEDYLKLLVDEGYLDINKYASYNITSYNEYYVPDIPTWSFVWAAADAAKRAKEDDVPTNGEGTLYPFIYKSNDNWVIQDFKQRDMKFTDDDGNIYIFNDSTKEFLKDLETKSRAGLYETFTKISYPANRFNKWESLMFVDSTAGASWVGVEATSSDAGSTHEGDDFKTAVRMIPQYDISNPKMISQGPSICILNQKDKQEVLASWLFAQFLLTDSIQIKYPQTEGYIPVTKSARESVEYQNYLNNNDNEYNQVVIDASKVVLNNIDNTFITSVFNGSADVREASGSLIASATAHKNRANSFTNEELDTLYSKIITNYKLPKDKIVGDVKKEQNYVIAIIMLITLGVIWIFIIIYIILERRKKKKII
jgi:multiple sugar transport system substrate-binding protein